MDTGELLAAQQLAREVLIADDILMVAVDIIQSTDPGQTDIEDIKRFVQYGSGPRGLQSLIRIAKARALTVGRYHVSIGDLKYVAKPVLRHRLLLNYEGEAEGADIDSLIGEVLDAAGRGKS